MCSNQPTRVFELFKDAHWTVLGHEVERDVVLPRPGLHIHTFGPRGDVIDEGDHFRAAYSLAPGDWVFVHPDGYIRAIICSSEIDILETYLRNIGLERGRRSETTAHETPNLLFGTESGVVVGRALISQEDCLLGHL